MSEVYIVIPCYKPRLDDLHECLDYLGLEKAYQDGTTVVVPTNGDTVPQSSRYVRIVTSDEVNLGKWWNTALNFIDYDARSVSLPEYEALLLGSDVRMSLDSVEMQRSALRKHDLAMVGADWHQVLQPGQIDIRRTNSQKDLRYRIPGVALMLAGELGLRADEQFRWWYADDDLEWQARALKGTGLVGGATLSHPPGGSALDGLRAKYAVEDREKFKAKWGQTPW